MVQPFSRYSRILLATNLVFAATLLLGAVGIFLNRWQRPSASDPVSEFISQRARSVAGSLMNELEGIRQETRATAELATHIFSNPESYRLAAQPGEYDFDQATGVYGSVRNDGTSAVFLSATSALNPDILREIRLSEYLNPVFKASASLNLLGRSIALYTSDGLVRSYPWFDFKSQITAGSLKRSFLVTDLPFFPKAIPVRNSSKEGVWEIVDSASQGKKSDLVCAAPFFAGDQFRGVIAIEVNEVKLAARLFRSLEPREALWLLLADDDRVIATNRKLESKAQQNGRVAAVLRDLKVTNLPELEPLLRRLAKADSFTGSQAGFRVSMESAAGLPVKPVLIVPEAYVAGHSNSFRGSDGLPGWLLIGTLLACALLLADTWWITQTRRNLAKSEKKLSESFTALSDLNLQSALIAGPQGSDPYPKFDDGLPSIQKAIEANNTTESVSVSEDVAEVAEKVGRHLKQIEFQAALFSAFDAAESAENNLSRLAAALRSVFEARLVTFLSYVESALRVLPQGGTSSVEKAGFDWKEGALFDALMKSEAVVSSNTLILTPEEKQLLGVLIQGDYLALPLVEEEKLVGAVVLSDKPSGVSADDEAFLGALQSVLTKTVRSIHQCDAFSKLNQLRREYCLELVKALRTPLDRIRTEVQSIYARLGKLTPYYKQHCETILFEVGKLYEMLREARETEASTEASVEPKVPEQAPSSEDALTTIDSKDRK